jgi:hypothetical protein
MAQCKQYKVFEEIYGMSEDKDERTVWLKVGISERLRNLFKSKVSAEGKTMNEVITEYIKDYVEGEKTKVPKSVSDNK